MHVNKSTPLRIQACNSDLKKFGPALYSCKLDTILPNQLVERLTDPARDWHRKASVIAIKFVNNTADKTKIIKIYQLLQSI